MSVMNQSGEEQVECPLCMEPLEVDDLHFYPCTCGYQICRFCWNRIREGENGLCPACRKAYPENPADFTPLSQEQVAAIKTEKKAREQKRRNKTLESRRALANVRVVQNNLVFVVGLPVRLADPEILKRQEYFGKYGKIHKVVINQSTTYAGSQLGCSQGPSASAYVTYVSPADALRAIQGVNNVTLDGRVLKGSLGTTKYCANFMKNQPCPKPDCMYLHELGDPKASFTKEEMHAGLHQVYERKLHNQLLNAQKDKPNDEKQNPTDNPNSNAEKGSSKDGNQSNFVPTTVVTSSHINVVNSSKSKKESMNGSSSSSSTGSSGSSGSSSSGISNGKEWPLLGSSPPDTNKRTSPKPQCTVKSQENGTSESSSPTQQPPAQPQQAQTKTKDNAESNKRNRNNTENGTNTTNGQTSKKSKSDNKSKQKYSNSINEPEDIDDIVEPQTSSVFENDAQQNYLTSELDELESDRHSLLENHDLLENSEHNLLEDDNTHNLLADANSEVMMMQRHREMLAGLVDNSHLLPQMKNPLVNGYGLIDRDTMSYIENDRQHSQISHGLLEKELMMREHSRNEMIMRQNELLARHNAMVEPKHYMPTSSLGLDSVSELLGANYHPNPNMLPTFGMRVDNSIGNNTMAVNSLSANTMSSSTMPGSSLGNSLGNPMGNHMGNSLVNTMGNPLSNSMGNAMANSMGGYMLHNQQLLQQNQQQQIQQGLVNGYDAPHTANEGRYLAENMDKFFTDFHKAQQMRLLLGRESNRIQEQPHYSPHTHTQQTHSNNTHNMLSAERLEMEHKQRMGGMRGDEGVGRAAGDADDDLDFDPFKETQKAFAELMETEQMQNNISSGDNMERMLRSRQPPPGFAHLHVPRQNQHHPDWTQMDPAIMSTSVNMNKNVQQPTLSQQQHELFARFNQLSVQPNGINKIQVPMHHQWPNNQKLQWPGHTYNNIPLPPGFAPPKQSQHPAECIDAK